MAVKGSAHHPMRVVQHRPTFYLLLKIALVVGFLVSVVLSYLMGVYAGKASYKSTDVEKIQQLQESIDALNQQLDSAHANGGVDQQAIENLRQQVMTQRAQLAAADRDMRVYKYLLSPAGRANPWVISFGVFTVIPTKDTGHFSYKLVVQKMSATESDFIGTLDFKVVGKQGGKTLKLPLHQISSQVAAANIPLNFKYFQTLEGEMQLPPEFVPQSVELSVYAGEDRGQVVVDSNQLEWPEVPH